VTRKRTPLSACFSREAFRLLERSYERVLDAPSDLEARGDMLLGSYFAGLAVEASMLGAAHACANPLTARCGVTHGVALAILLPHVVRWNGQVAVERYSALLGSPHRRARDTEAPESLARRLEDFAVAADLPARLSDVGVTEDTLPELADLVAQQWTGTFNPRPFDAAGAFEIYQAAF
jgi:alcohol dehydrogenase